MFFHHVNKRNPYVRIIEVTHLLGIYVSRNVSFEIDIHSTIIPPAQIGLEIHVVGKKYQDKASLASKTLFSRHCFGFQNRRFSLLLGYNI